MANPSPSAGPRVRPTAVALPPVLHRYQLPRVAFVFVSVASLAGAILTGMRLGIGDWPVWLLRWGAYWVLALLVGAQMWNLLYLRPAVRARPVDGAVAYGQAMLDLYRRWLRVLVPAAIGLTTATVWIHAQRGAGGGPWSAVTAAALALAVAGLIADWRQPRSVTDPHPGGWTALAALAAVVALLAGRDVLLQHGPSPWLLVPARVLHTWAFSVWLGGALWNIFIAVPTGQRHLHLDAVILANIQLERFRIAVRLVFPTLIATGLIQTWGMLGWNLTLLVTTHWGHLVLIKVGLILALVAVFILCPMWRACSPVRGVCDLDDLN